MSSHDNTPGNKLYFLVELKNLCQPGEVLHGKNRQQSVVIRNYADFFHMR